MDENALIQYITQTFDGIATVEAMEATFFYYDLPGDQAPDRKFPFATLVTNDQHDTASNLERPAVYRLNIGVSRKTYRSLFGPQPVFPRDGGTIDTGHDFTALDQLMPHPIYAAMSWVCVLNPSVTTFETCKPLLAEAHQMSVDRAQKKTTPECDT